MANNSDMNVALRFQADVTQALRDLKQVRAEMEAMASAGGKVDGQGVSALASATEKAAKAADSQASSSAKASEAARQNAAAVKEQARAAEAVAVAQAKAAEQQERAAQAAKAAQEKALATEAAAAQKKATQDQARAAKAEAAALAKATRDQERAAKAAAEAQIKASKEQERAAKAAAAAQVRAAKEQQRAAAKALADANAATKAATKPARTEANLKKNADRMLPAQMTDITVGLSTGQSPFTVALQQGGQLKDMYGGIVPAAKAVSAATLGMVNPYTVAAAAVVGLGVAWHSAAKETEGYTKAIVLNGNAAGTTVSQLTAAARSVGEVTGSYGLANEAVTRLAATGRVSNSVIAQTAQSTVRMAKATGTSVDEMVQQFAELGKAPVEASRKLNEQYNYLTLSIYQQIKALEEQGRKEEAAALAQRSFAQAMDQRSNEVLQSLNALGKGFQWVGEKASGMWQSIKDSVKTAPLAAQLAEAKKEYLFLTKMSSQGSKMANFFGIEGYDSTKDDRLAAYKKMTDLQRQMDAETKRASDQQKRTQEAAAGIAADQSWDRRAKSLRDWKAQLKDEIKAIQDEGKLLGKTQEQINDQIKAATEKLTPKTPKGAGPKVNPVDTAYQTQLQTLQQARAQAAQNLANAEADVASNQEQATVKLESWLTVNKHALKLDDARIAKLREAAAETDRLNKATKDLQDTRARNERITQGLAAVDEGISQAQGRSAEAAVTRIEERFRKLRDDLGKVGNLEGLAKVDQLVGIESARAQLESLQQQADRIFSDQSRTEQSLANQVTAGLTGELEAKRQILNINTSTAAQIEALLPKMRELAEITGNPAAIDRVKDLEVRIQGLRTKANEVSQAFSNAFGNSLSNSLKSLADGTASLGEAVRGLLSNLAQGMGEWAAQQLALRAQDGLIGLINGTGKTAAGAGAASVASTAVAGVGAVVDTAGAATEAATLAASTAATVADTAATTAAAAATTAMATAATLAATALQAVAASSASSGAGNALGILGAGFSSGGWTGPGTKFQPAGIVHADEFVHRQEVVRQPGALAFLTRFNQVGMAALKGWQGYADGGLVVGAGASLGIPSVGNFKPATPAMGGSTTVDNKLQVNVFDDPQRIADHMASRAGDAAFTVLMTRNPAKYRQILGL